MKVTISLLIVLVSQSALAHVDVLLGNKFQGDLTCLIAMKETSLSDSFVAPISSERRNKKLIDFAVVPAPRGGKPGFYVFTKDGYSKWFSLQDVKDGAFVQAYFVDDDGKPRGFFAKVSLNTTPIGFSEFDDTLRSGSVPVPLSRRMEIPDEEALKALRDVTLKSVDFGVDQRTGIPTGNDIRRGRLKEIEAELGKRPEDDSKDQEKVRRLARNTDVIKMSTAELLKEKSALTNELPLNESESKFVTNAHSSVLEKALKVCKEKADSAEILSKVGALLDTKSEGVIHPATSHQ